MINFYLNSNALDRSSIFKSIIHAMINNELGADLIIKTSNCFKINHVPNEPNDNIINQTKLAINREYINGK